MRQSHLPKQFILDEDGAVDRVVLVLRPAVWIVADKEVQVAIMVQISKHSRPRVDHRLTKVGRVVRVNLGEVGVPVVQKQFGRCAECEVVLVAS